MGKTKRSLAVPILVILGLLGHLLLYAEANRPDCWVREFQREQGWDDKVTNTTPLLSLSSPSAASCGQACEQLWRCRAFHFIPSSGLCLLYASRMVNVPTTPSPGSRFFYTRCPPAQNFSNVSGIQVRVVETSIAWLPARQRCRQHNPCADLAKLHTPTLLQNVVSHTLQLVSRPRNFLVGVQKDAGPGGQWAWLDGEPMLAPLWYPGQPDTDNDTKATTSRSYCSGGKCLHDVLAKKEMDGYICQLFV